MVKKIVSLAVAGIFLCSAAFALSGSCGSGDAKAVEKSAGTVAPIKVNNTICPVTGEKVDMKDPVTVEYNGKIYNLCCQMCPDEFKKDPAKYIAKIDAQKK